MLVEITADNVKTPLPSYQEMDTAIRQANSHRELEQVLSSWVSSTLLKSIQDATSSQEIENLLSDLRPNLPCSERESKRFEAKVACIDKIHQVGIANGILDRVSLGAILYLPIFEEHLEKLIERLASNSKIQLLDRVVLGHCILNYKIDSERLTWVIAFIEQCTWSGNLEALDPASFATLLAPARYERSGYTDVYFIGEAMYNLRCAHRRELLDHVTFKTLLDKRFFARDISSCIQILCDLNKDDFLTTPILRRLIESANAKIVACMQVLLMAHRSEVLTKDTFAALLAVPKHVPYVTECIHVLWRVRKAGFLTSTGFAALIAAGRNAQWAQAVIEGLEILNSTGVWDEPTLTTLFQAGPLAKSVWEFIQHNRVKLAQNPQCGIFVQQQIQELQSSQALVACASDASKGSNGVSFSSYTPYRKANIQENLNGGTSACAIERAVPQSSRFTRVGSCRY